MHFAWALVTMVKRSAARADLASEVPTAKKPKSYMTVEQTVPNKLCDNFKKFDNTEVDVKKAAGPDGVHFTLREVHTYYCNTALKDGSNPFTPSL